MRLPAILFATAMCVSLVTPAFPTDGPVTIRFKPPSTIRWASVTGGPYSAVQSQQSVQTLADGTRLTTKAREEITTWRDSAGRRRTETRAAQSEKTKPCNSNMLTIADPVAGYAYLLDRSIRWRTDSCSRRRRRHPRKRLLCSSQLRPLPAGQCGGYTEPRNGHRWAPNYGASLSEPWVSARH
jgi:hypothetical protein